jgi:hypothetical protein
MKYLIVLLFLLTCCNKVEDTLTLEEMAKIDSKTGSYIYPVERGEQKLFELGFDKYYDTCIIPTNILHHLTSEGLIASCLNYPPYFNIFYFDNYQDGFDRIVSKSNVFTELFSRKDVASRLISKYNNQVVDPFVVDNYVQKGTFTIIYLEILLSQEQSINQMSFQMKDKVIKEVLQKIDYRNTVLKEQLFSSVISSLILGRVLKSMQYSNFIAALKQDQNLSAFLKKGTYYDTISTSKIIIFSQEYIKNK